MESSSGNNQVLVSVLNTICYRAVFSVLGISCVFLFGSFLVDRLIVRRYKLPEHDLAPTESVHFEISHHNSSFESHSDSLEDSDAIEQPLLNPDFHHTRLKRFVPSPTPEDDEYLQFDRLQFYKNLNNSSQFLRRDSFIE